MRFVSAGGPHLLFQEVFELLAAAGVTQFAQRLGLDLADTFTGYIKLFSYLFQGAAAAILQTEAQLEHLLLSRGEGGQHIAQLLLEQGV